MVFCLMLIIDKNSNKKQCSMPVSRWDLHSGTLLIQSKTMLDIQFGKSLTRI